MTRAYRAASAVDGNSATAGRSASTAATWAATSICTSCRIALARFAMASDDELGEHHRSWRPAVTQTAEIRWQPAEIHVRNTDFSTLIGEQCYDVHP